MELSFSTQLKVVDYQSRLDLRETETALKIIKDYFESRLSKALNLTRVSAPLFVKMKSGLNDNLNGVERPVSFSVKGLDEQSVEIVHSLAKWKRLALYRYGFIEGEGIYTDMNAIRRDEHLDCTHSIYVDQWDWEKVISEHTRTTATLKEHVRQIYRALKDTEDHICTMYSCLSPMLPAEISFITTQVLEDMYPHLSPIERECRIAQRVGAVFVMQVGHKLKSGIKHGGRAPDYDDWRLNGDIIVWHPVLGQALELSSMGIRVDEVTLDYQLKLTGCTERKGLPFHRMLLNGELPYTIGGGIGQSRMCMLLLNKAHIGEVQAAIWPKEMVDACEEANIRLL